ncbi:MAG: hypothetical protein CMO01_03455 [Thalassobius sp.]|nr:hypothetical protein [Thalassovita sp.]
MKSVLANDATNAMCCFLIKYMDAELLIYFCYLLVGIVAGVVNTLAGGASVLILSILLFMGMPANIANGTNRLGILVQNFTGTSTFYKSGLLDVQGSLKYIIPSVIGAIGGAMIASDIDQDTLEIFVGVIMTFMLIPIIFKPQGKKSAFYKNKDKKGFKILNFVIFLLIGFYGGFVQAGIGLIIMVVLPQISNLSLIKGNAVKMAIIFIYTVPVMLVFIINGQVDWWVAIWLAIGQVLGTRIAGKFVVNHPQANKWVRVLLICMVSVSIIKMFGIVDIVLATLDNNT